MSVTFKCLDWKKNRLVELEGICKASLLTGNGTPGIYFRIPKGCSFVPAAEFCEIIRYFLENYDLTAEDPRLELLEDMKKAKRVKGYNGSRSRRLDLRRG